MGKIKVIVTEEGQIKIEAKDSKVSLAKRQLTLS